MVNGDNMAEDATFDAVVKAFAEAPQEEKGAFHRICSGPPEDATEVDLEAVAPLLERIEQVLSDEKLIEKLIKPATVAEILAMDRRVLDHMVKNSQLKREEIKEAEMQRVYKDHVEGTDWENIPDKQPAIG